MATYSLERHTDQYKCIAISTIHLTDEDIDKLGAASVSSNMITERDTGFFIKLYDKAEHNQNLCDNLSESAQGIIMTAFEQGFRMIEFDSDAESLMMIIN